MTLTEYEWGFAPPAALVKPVPAPPALPPEIVPLGQAYKPLADAYRRGGLQDFSVADIDVPNPEFERSREQADDTPPSSAELGYTTLEAAQMLTRRPTVRHGGRLGMPLSEQEDVEEDAFGRLIDPRVDAAGRRAAGEFWGRVGDVVATPGRVSRAALGQSSIFFDENKRQQFDDITRQIAAETGRRSTDLSVQLDAGQELWEQNTKGLEGPGGANVAKGAVEFFADPTNLIGAGSIAAVKGAAKGGAKAVLGDLTKDEVNRLAKELPAASAALTAAAKSGDQAAMDAAVATLKDLKVPDKVISDSVKRAIRDTAAGTARTLGKSEEEIAAVAAAAKLKAAKTAATVTPGAETNEALAAAQGKAFAPGTGAALKPGSKPPVDVPPPAGQNTAPLVEGGKLTKTGADVVMGRGQKAAGRPAGGTGGGLNARIAAGPPPGAKGVGGGAGAPPGGGAVGAAGGGAAKTPPYTILGAADKGILEGLEKGVNAYSAPKSALSSGDVSLSGRQFFAFAFSHPKEWIEGLGRGLGAYRDPNKAFSDADSIAQRTKSILEDYGLRADELEIPTKASGGLGSSTNFASAPWFVQGKYNPLKYTMGPILERSEAAAAITAATIRGHVFDDQVSGRALKALQGMGYNSTKQTAVNDLAKVMNAGTFQAITQTRKQMAALGYGDALGADQVKELARALNHASGRGYTMPEGSVLARTANLVGNVALFSPQNTTARVRFFADVLGAAKTVGADVVRGRPVDPVDMEKLRLGVGYAAGVTGLLTAAASLGLPVNLDPTSTEFLKIDLGEPGAEKAPLAAALAGLGIGTQTYQINGKTHVMLDVTGGGSQLIRTIAREAILIPKALTNSLGDLKGTNLAGKTPGGEAGQFLRNKAAPVTGSIMDVAQNKAQVTDERVLTDNPISSLFIFLTLQDAIEAGGFTEGAGSGPRPQQQRPSAPKRGGAGVYPQR